MISRKFFENHDICWKFFGFLINTRFDFDNLYVDVYVFVECIHLEGEGYFNKDVEEKHMFVKEFKKRKVGHNSLEKIIVFPLDQ
jgi:hypothetical protein